MLRDNWAEVILRNARRNPILNLFASDKNIFIFVNFSAIAIIDIDPSMDAVGIPFVPSAEIKGMAIPILIMASVVMHKVASLNRPCARKPVNRKLELLARSAAMPISENVVVPA